MTGVGFYQISESGGIVWPSPSTSPTRPSFDKQLIKGFENSKHSEVSVILVQCPRARIVTLKAEDKNNIQSFFEPPSRITSSSERTIAHGPFKLYRIRAHNSVFLQCSNVVHPVLKRLRCWKVAPNCFLLPLPTSGVYWRIEIDSNDDELFAQLEEKFAQSCSLLQYDSQERGEWILDPRNFSPLSSPEPDDFAVSLSPNRHHGFPQRTTSPSRDDMQPHRANITSKNRIEEADKFVTERFASHLRRRNASIISESDSAYSSASEHEAHWASSDGSAASSPAHKICSNKISSISLEAETNEQMASDTDCLRVMEDRPVVQFAMRKSDEISGPGRSEVSLYSPLYLVASELEWNDIEYNSHDLAHQSSNLERSFRYHYNEIMQAAVSDQKTEYENAKNIAIMNTPNRRSVTYRIWRFIYNLFVRRRTNDENTLRETAEDPNLTFEVSHDDSSLSQTSEPVVQTADTMALPEELPSSPILNERESEQMA
ncbi:inheritance of peroxisomes protein 1-domain-containing protein [Dipodascopsis uninucleata]